MRWVRITALVALLLAQAPEVVVTPSVEAAVIEAQGGQYRVELGSATANSNEHDPRDYVVGGDPVILVEWPDGDPIAAFRPIE